MQPGAAVTDLFILSRIVLQAHCGTTLPSAKHFLLRLQNCQHFHLEICQRKESKYRHRVSPGRMAKWNALCIAQVSMTSGQGTTSGTHNTRSPPRQAVTDITSLQAAQTTRMPPSETKRMPQSSTCDKETPNILLGPLDFIATSLTAVSHWNVDTLALPASSVTKVLIPA